MKEPMTQGPSRAYRKRARALKEEETRQRIVDAAISLHESVGPQGASISAIAKCAGVGRVTVYRHFPNDATIIDACTRRYFELHPPPQVAAWASLANQDELLCKVVDDIYDYYQANETMLTQGTAVAVSVPYLATRMAEIDAHWDGVRDWLIGRLAPDDPSNLYTSALVGLLLSFSGWQSLVRHQRLSFTEAKSMAIEVISTKLGPDSQA